MIPDLEKLKELPPSEVQKLPIPLRLELPPVSKWDAVKAFFAYSETVALARAEAVIGFFTMAVGAMDWSPLLAIDYSTAFNKTQVIALGAISFVKGIFTELVRRRNMLETKYITPDIK